MPSVILRSLLASRNEAVILVVAGNSWMPKRRQEKCVRYGSILLIRLFRTDEAFCSRPCFASSEC